MIATIIKNVYHYFRATMGVRESVAATIKATGLANDRVLDALGMLGMDWNRP